jgi:hypothetical protein
MSQSGAVFNRILGKSTVNLIIITNFTQTTLIPYGWLENILHNFSTEIS